MEEAAAEKALILLRSRLCNPNFLFTPLSDSPDSNYSKLKFIITNSITEACNNSLLLLGPRGCGKTAVLELVLRDLNVEYPNMISLVRLNGLLHSDDNCAIKLKVAWLMLVPSDNLSKLGDCASLVENPNSFELFVSWLSFGLFGKKGTITLSMEIARQLCLEHQLLFSKMASFDDNTQFMIAMLRECGLAHKTIIFVLDEFDLFTQGKQRLLYSLLDTLQSLTSQAVVIGVSCRLDADQLLEKRVRSRFSHRKLLFVPPSTEDIQRLLEHILSLPTDLDVPHDYAAEFNAKIHNIVGDHGFVEILNSLSNVDASVSYLLRFLFHAVSFMDLESGFLSLENFRTAISCIQRQPKLETLQDASILEFYLLVCMHRLEVKEQNSYNFNSIMKEYKSVHDAYQTSDYYARNVCLRAFEHLLERELVSFTDSRGQNLSIEFRPVKLLVASQELYQGLQSNRSCPAILQKLFNRESYN